MENRVYAIICNHNYGHYIKYAIDGIKKQTYHTVPVIIDDSSTDNSWELINKEFDNSYQEKHTEQCLVRYNDKLIAIKTRQTSGPSHCRNLGIQFIWPNFSHVLICDADDVPYPNKAEKLLKIFEENESVGLAYGDYDILNVNTGNIIREFKEPYSKIRLNQDCIVHSNFMISQKALEYIFEPTGWYDVNLRCVEDWDVELRVSERFLLMHIAESLTLVRNHNNNSTNSVNKEIWQQCWTRVNQKMQQRYANQR